MGLAVSATNLAGMLRLTTLDLTLSDFVDQGPGTEAEGLATVAGLVPEGWYLNHWTAEILEVFAGGAASEIRLRVGKSSATDNVFTGGGADGQRVDTGAGDAIAGSPKQTSNGPFVLDGANMEFTLKVVAGSQDFSDLTAGALRVVIACAPHPGF
jgi:hypothetical protein